ncbi:MAG: type II toxin-antitoxin system HicB family antitoxin [Rhodomicrobium sp.]
MWYEIEVERDDDGTLLVTVPAFPGVSTFSKTIDAAPRCAQAAIEEAIAARMADREELPHPEAKQENRGYWSEVTLLTYIKSLLYMLCRTEGLTRADLARLLRVRRETVDRLFRLEHESKLSQFERAFQAIGYPFSLGTIHAPRAGRPESVTWGRWDRPSASTCDC